jgi:hypothetical protein
VHAARDRPARGVTAVILDQIPARQRAVVAVAEIADRLVGKPGIVVRLCVPEVKVCVDD